MADVCDIATDYAEQELARNLQRHRANQATVFVAEVSATHCIDCDDPIPPARRPALPGCQLCVPCAELREQQSRTSLGR